MKRIEPEQIGDVLRELFRQSCMEERLDERKAVHLWRDVVGESIARKCLLPSVANGVMTVNVTDASLRNELSMTRTVLKNMINKIIGKETIKDIRFVS